MQSTMCAVCHPTSSKDSLGDPSRSNNPGLTNRTIGLASAAQHHMILCIYIYIYIYIYIHNSYIYICIQYIYRRYIHICLFIHTQSYTYVYVFIYSYEWRTKLLATRNGHGQSGVVPYRFWSFVCVRMGYRQVGAPVPVVKVFAQIWNPYSNPYYFHLPSFVSNSGTLHISINTYIYIYTHHYIAPING